MTADQLASLGAGIKAAIDAAVSNSLQVSVKAALDRKIAYTVCVYKIDPAGLDDTGAAAAHSDDGISLPVIQALLGHANLKTAGTLSSFRRHHRHSACSAVSI